MAERGLRCSRVFNVVVAQKKSDFEHGSKSLSLLCGFGFCKRLSRSREPGRDGIDYWLRDSGLMVFPSARAHRSIRALRSIEPLRYCTEASPMTACEPEVWNE